MAQNGFNINAYTRNQPELRFPQPPVIAKRDPGNNDRYDLGALWVNKSTNAAFILTSYNSSGNPVWEDITGGAGSFSSLTVTPGPISLTGTTTINTSGAANTSIGTGSNSGTVSIGNASSTAVSIVGPVSVNAGGSLNTAIAATNNAGTVSIGNSASGAITITSGTGNFSLVGGGNTIGLANDAAANLVTIGSNSGAASLTLQAGSGNFAINPAVGSTITIGNAAQQGKISIGDSTAALTVDVLNGVNTGAQVLNIGSNTPAANVTLNVLTSAASAGTQIFNLFGSGATRAGNVNIANGAAAHVVVLGSTNGAAQTTIQAGSGGLALSAAGAVSMTPSTTGSPVASPTNSVTNNSRVGSCVFTGFTTASAGAQAFTITNSAITSSSAIFATVSNVHNANDAQMTLVSVVIAAAGGSMTINTKNNGAGALDGNVIINWWILS